MQSYVHYDYDDTTIIPVLVDDSHPIPPLAINITCFKIFDGVSLIFLVLSAKMLVEPKYIVSLILFGQEYYLLQGY